MCVPFKFLNSQHPIHSPKDHPLAHSPIKTNTDALGDSLGEYLPGTAFTQGIHPESIAPGVCLIIRGIPPEYSRQKWEQEEQEEEGEEEEVEVEVEVEVGEVK